MLLGHRYDTARSLKNMPINVVGLAWTPAQALFRLLLTIDRAAMHCSEQTPLPSEVMRPVLVISALVQSEMSPL